MPLTGLYFICGEGANNRRDTPDTPDISPIQYLPFELMDKSVTQYAKSNLYPFLVKSFGAEPASQLC